MHQSHGSPDHLWLPFTPNRQFHQQPRVMVGADGMHFTTQQGQQVLDGISSLWCVVAGHNIKPINEAIHQQLERLDYATAFQFGSDRAFEAAHRIADWAPGDLNKVLFCSSGSEAADTAVKLALAYHRARGQSQRQVFIGRERGYHGVGLGGMSIGGIPGNRKVFGAAMMARVDHMRFIHDPQHHAYIHNELPEWHEDPLLELEQRILPLHDPSNIAAIFVEPVAGSAGWYIPPKGYLQRLRQICDQHGILLVFDEVITGFGRLGAPFAADFFGVVPDMITFAKGVTNGVIPLGGVICREAIHAGIMQSDAPVHAIEFAHGYTYSGHPVACAAAVATLDWFEQEDLLARAQRTAPLLGEAVHSAIRGLPGVVGIRSLGMAAAVEMAANPQAPGKKAFDIFLDCLSHGVLVRSAGDNLVLAPAYVVTPAQLAQMVDTLAAAIRRQA